MFFFLRGWEGFQFFTLTMTIHGACSQGRVGLSKRVKLSESIWICVEACMAKASVTWIKVRAMGVQTMKMAKCEAGVGRCSECWYIFQGIKCRKKTFLQLLHYLLHGNLDSLKPFQAAELCFVLLLLKKMDSLTQPKKPTGSAGHSHHQISWGKVFSALSEEEKGCVSEEVPRSSSKVWCWHESFLGCRRWEEDHPKEEQKTAKEKGGKTMKDPEAPKKPEVPMVAALPKTAQLSWKSVLASQWRPSPNWLLPSGRSWVLMKRRSWRWIPGKESSISTSHEILCAQSGSGSGSGRSWTSREEGQDQDREGRESG